MIERILVPVDGSGYSKKALVFASDIAGKYGARVDLVHVVQPAPGERVLVLGATSLSLEADKAELEAAGRNILQAARQMAEDSGCRVGETAILSGPAAEKILESARNFKTDLIVMGSRGLSDLAGLLLGSISHKVSHLAECSCVTVR